jgi:nitrile hydratase
MESPLEMADNSADNTPLKPHDMGGQPAGPVQADFGGEPVFKQAWHGRALALTLAAGALGKWNLDASRNAREMLPARDYQRFGYYEKWLAGLANLLVRHQLVSRDELASGQADKNSPAIEARPLPAARVAAVLKKGGPTRRPVARSPRFSIGERVQTRAPQQVARQPDGHTRLPHYASVKAGHIRACYGAHILPDSHAYFMGEAPEYLYNVQFLAGDLFPDAEQPDDVICLDLFESYLESVS